MSIVELLRENTEQVKRDAGDILVKLLSNIVAAPNDMKYRQIKLANKTIEEKLLPASGAFEILFSVGFEEAEDKLILPMSVNIRTVERFLEALKNIDNKPTPVEAVNTQPAAATASTSESSALIQPGVLTSEREFLARLVSCSNHMDAYEDKTAQVCILL